MRSRLGIPATVVVALVATLLLLGVGASAGPAVRTAAPVVRGAHDDTSTPFTLVDVPALVRHPLDGHGLRLDTLLERDPAYERWAISYRGDGLRATGALTVPSAPGAHPVVVVAHGFAPRGRYVQGSGPSREERRLGREGYVVLHPDYRNWGGSQVESGRAVARPLGYPEDVLNAVVALRRARFAGVDTSRMALLGRSMGGAVATQVAVARPGTPLAARVRAAYGSTADRLQALGTPVSAYAYPGEHHRFTHQWPRFMARASDFFTRVLHA